MIECPAWLDLESVAAPAEVWETGCVRPELRAAGTSQTRREAWASGTPRSHGGRRVRTSRADSTFAPSRRGLRRPRRREGNRMHLDPEALVRLYRRGGQWWAAFHEDGKHVRKSLGTRFLADARL